MTRRLATLLSVVVLLVACSGRSSSPSAAMSGSPGASAAPVELTIYAAASLRAALDEAKAAYEASNPGTTMTISTDSSSALETQIEQGAPADVFLSADTANPEKLVDGGYTSGAAVTFAANTLVVIVPSDNPGGVTTPADLARSGLRVIAAGDAVPITGYATQLVANLASEPDYPADFAARYAANIASKEDNVSAVLAKVELGEGDAAIVYVTDAMASTEVRAVDVPESSNVLASYAGVVVKASPNQEAARDFLTWFAGPDGQTILTSVGFLPPS